MFNVTFNFDNDDEDSDEGGQDNDDDVVGDDGDYQQSGDYQQQLANEGMIDGRRACLPHLTTSLSGRISKYFFCHFLTISVAKY